ncbi:MAG TPA: hypothetical protein VM941_09450, partial [Pyrinomonadaceae bacterium]|nr:hypothetical protein [Pyrinomonadaceae bacterium]
MRSKSFLTCFVICAVPLLLLAALNYWNGTRSVNNTMNTIVHNDLRSFNTAVDNLLTEQGRAILRLAVAPEVRRALIDPSVRSSLDASLKPVVELAQLKSLAVYDRNHQRVWSSGSEQQPEPDSRVWTTKGRVLVERLIDDWYPNHGFEYSVPIQAATGVNNEGAVVALVDPQRV